jgi:sugar phosphate isomerase/epimerase
MFSRRRFIIGSAALAAAPASATGRIALGLQLYTVRDDLARDFDGTLKKIAAMGIRKVQTNLSLNGRDALRLRQIFDGLDLGWDSCHAGGDELRGALQQTIEKAHLAKLKNITCSFPLYPTDFAAAVKGPSLDDWKRDADAYNRIGEQVTRAGLSFGYHNHNIEFRPLDGTCGYDILLARTDPKLVRMEMDIGWVVAGGADPVRYLTRFPERYAALHLKDLKRNFIPNYQLKMTSAIVGQGIVDWTAVLAAARKTRVTDAYIELEAPYQPSPLAMVRASFDYLRPRF